VLVGIDQRLECRPVNQTLFDQQGFERFDSQSDVRRNVSVNVTVGVRMFRHGCRSGRSDCGSQKITSGGMHPRSLYRAF
jgi:hypothetical protein